MTLLGKVLPLPLEHSGELIITRTCSLREAEAAALASGDPAANDATNGWKTRH
jgi:hypothetical protein